MKRYAVGILVALVCATAPSQAQFLKKLEQDLMGGQQQGLMPGQQAQATVVGNVNLPPGQYLMTNVQTGQAFYVSVQNGQMFLTGQPAPTMLAPGQGMMQQQQPAGTGGFMQGGLGNLLKKELGP